MEVSPPGAHQRRVWGEHTALGPAHVGHAHHPSSHPRAAPPPPTPIAFKGRSSQGRAAQPPGCSTSLTCLTSHSTRPLQAPCSCDTPAFPPTSLTSLVKQEAWGGVQESGLGSYSELSNRRQPQDFRVLVKMQIPPPGLKY